MQTVFVVIVTTLILAYLGNALRVMVDAGHYWVLPAGVPLVLAFGYAMGTAEDRADMRDKARLLINWLRRR